MFASCVWVSGLIESRKLECSSCSLYIKVLCWKLCEFEEFNIYYLTINYDYIIGHYFEMHNWYLFSRKVIVMRTFCCNSAYGFHEISACEWHTVELLKQTEQSRCDTHIKNETLRLKRILQFSNCELSIYICSSIQAAVAYGVYISWLIRYFRACDSYHDFHDRRLLLTRKLLSQGFPVLKLKSSLQKFYGRHY